MKNFSRSLLLIGLSGCFLGGCVATDIQDGEEIDETLTYVEDADQEQEALGYSKEDLSASEIEGEYWTEVCSGYSGPGSMCQVRCSNGVWYQVGRVPYGECTTQGNWFCAYWGMYATGHCWN